MIISFAFVLKVEQKQSSSEIKKKCLVRTERFIGIYIFSMIIIHILVAAYTLFDLMDDFDEDCDIYE
jgi:hypothetical protein